MTPAEQMLAEEAAQTAIVAKAEAIISPLLARMSSREALGELVGSDAIAEILAGKNEGDYWLALYERAREMAEQESEAQITPVSVPRPSRDS